MRLTCGKYKFNSDDDFDVAPHFSLIIGQTRHRADATRCQ